MNWDRRNQVFLLGAPLAVVPAVAFLPAFVFVFLRYPIVKTLPGFQLWFAGFRPRIGYVSLLAAATSVFLLVVAAYTGLFFAIFAGPN
jgi:hypothetical protein